MFAINHFLNETVTIFLLKNLLIGFKTESPLEKGIQSSKYTGACTVTVQIQKDNCNSSFENSTTSSNSADSARVDLNIK
jgi:hypothetical protein